MASRSTAAIALSLVSCVADLKPPDGSAISCSRQGDCPPLWVCNATIGRCVDPSREDTTAPSVTRSTIKPNFVGPGAIVRVTLETDEPLAAPPQVSADGLLADFLLVSQDDNQRLWTLEYTLRGEVDGVYKLLATDLADRSGNQNAAVELGPLTVDSTPPTDVVARLEPAAKTASSSIALVLSAVGATQVLLGGDLAPSHTGEWQAYGARLDVELSPGEGTKTILLHLRDAARNSTTVFSLAIVVDLTAPTGEVQLNLDNDRTAMAGGSSAAVQGNASADSTMTSAAILYLSVGGEELRRDSTISTLALMDGRLSGNLTLGQVPSGTATARLEIVLNDGATSVTVLSPAMDIDDTPPEALSLTLDAGAPVDGYTATFDTPGRLLINNTGKPDVSDLQMRIDGSGVDALDPLKGLWLPYSSRIVVNLADGGDGVRLVEVSVRDRAGNTTGPVSSTITLDTKAPISTAVGLAGSAVSATTAVTLQLQANGAPQVRIYGDDVLVDANTHAWIDVDPSGEVTINVVASPGGKSIAVAYRDRAGNVSEPVSTTVVISSDRPLSAPIMTPPNKQRRLKFGDVVPISGSGWQDTAIESKRYVFSDANGTAVDALPSTPLPNVVLNASNNFVGTLSLLESEIPATASFISVEVVLLRNGGSKDNDNDTSEAEFSRSSPLLIDRTPPTAPVLRLVGDPTELNTQLIEPVLGVINSGEADETELGDIEYQISGTGVDPSTIGVNDWLSFDSSHKIVLTGGEGSKSVVVTYRDGAHQQVATQLALIFDVTPPLLPLSSPAFELSNGAPKSGSRTLMAQLSADGASHMRFSGDLVGPPAALDWADFAANAEIQLLDEDRPQILSVRLRDLAGNDVDVQDTIILDQSIPFAVVPLTVELDGRTALASGATYRLSGELSEVGLTIAQAELQANTGTGGAFELLESLAARVEIAGLTLRDIAPIASTGLGHGVTVRASVTVTDGVNSATLLSDGVTIDNNAPTIDSLTLTGGGTLVGTSTTRAVLLTISSTGAAIQIRLSGDIDTNPYSDWAAYDFSAAIALTLEAGDGPKSITAEVRDGAHNTTSAGGGTILDTVPPDTAVGISIDFGQRAAGKTHVRSGDSGVIAIDGSTAEANTVITAARILGLVGTAGTSLRPLALGSEISVSPFTGALSGSFTLSGLDLSGYDGLAIDVSVEDLAGNAELQVRSAGSLPVDVAPPTGASIVLATEQSNPTNRRQVTVRTQATKGRLVCLFGGATTNGATYCDSDDNYTLSGNTGVVVSTVRLTPGDANKVIFARFRDQAFNAVEAQVSIRLDTQAPTFSFSWTPGQGNVTVPDPAGGSADQFWILNDSAAAQLVFSPAELPVEMLFGGVNNTSIVGCTPVVDSFCRKSFVDADCPAGNCVVALQLGVPAVTAAPCWDDAHAPGDGTRGVSLRLQDEAGNVADPQLLSAFLDRTCPTAPTLSAITSPTIVNDSYVPSTTLFLSVDKSADDADFVDHIWSLNGTELNSPSSPPLGSFAFTGLIAGSNLLQVRGIDLGGRRGPTADLMVFSDVQPPSAPEVGPQDLTLNLGEHGVAVTITTLSVDPSPGTAAGQMAYQVFGGPYEQWTDAPLNPLFFAAGYRPVFALAGPFAEDQSFAIFVRAVDLAGNPSPPALFSGTEVSARTVATSSSRLVEISVGTGFEEAVGLWGDHLVWSDNAFQGASSFTRVMHTDLAGITDELFRATCGSCALSGEIQSNGRFVSWWGADASARRVYLYDLGADELVATNDAELDSNPKIVDTLLSDFSRYAWDFDTLELVTMDGDAPNGVRVRQLQLNGVGALHTVVQDHSLCSNCLDTSASQRGFLDIDEGCIAWSNAARHIELRCRVNDVWGDGDDSTRLLTATTGDCSAEHPPTQGGRRNLAMTYVAGQRVVVWAERQSQAFREPQRICLWGESSGAAQGFELSGQSGFHGLALSGRHLYSVEAKDANVHLVRHRVLNDADLFAGEWTTLSIPAGGLSRVGAWQDRVAVARQRDGDDTLELHHNLAEYQVSEGVSNKVSPDVDGPRTVWVDYRHHACGEIYMVDRGRTAEMRLTTTVCSGASTPFNLCPRISGDYVAWHQETASSAPRFCRGRVLGMSVVDLPYVPVGQVDITSRLTAEGFTDGNIGQLEIDGGIVVFSAATTAIDRRLYAYDFATGVKPSGAAPLNTDLGQNPSVANGRIVYTAIDYPSGSDYRIRACTLSAGSCPPTTIAGIAPGVCSDKNDSFCQFKGQPAINGDLLVWYDNRNAFGNGFSSMVLHLYVYDFASPVADGVRLTRTPMTSGWGSNDLYQQYLAFPGAYPLASWDNLRPTVGRNPSNGEAYVVFTSLRKDYQQGFAVAPDHREAMVIAINGERALVERTLTSDSSWQSTPSADSTGQIVWQDRRGGTLFQIISATSP